MPCLQRRTEENINNITNTTMNKEEMKQYTGTKTVKSMPMTMYEAYERKL